ncbi:protein FAM3B-like [Paramormyrops kingsleyae]|uniref:protein FAM3B-like n=1 Tax=Paramormyrops kingsleyae TaxID=1676925 RepID=UPI003B9721F5
MATDDEGSSKLKHEAKEEMKKLGSNLIDQISFRSSWVLLGTKGVPEHLKRETTSVSQTSPWGSLRRSTFLLPPKCLGIDHCCRPLS